MKDRIRKAWLINTNKKFKGCKKKSELNNRLNRIQKPNNKRKFLPWKVRLRHKKKKSKTKNNQVNNFNNIYKFVFKYFF